MLTNFPPNYNRLYAINKNYLKIKKIVKPIDTSNNIKKESNMSKKEDNMRRIIMSCLTSIRLEKEDIEFFTKSDLDKSEQINMLTPHQYNLVLAWVKSEYQRISNQNLGMECCDD
jgi:hypothetical protein